MHIKLRPALAAVIALLCAPVGAAETAKSLDVIIVTDIAETELPNAARIDGDDMTAQRTTSSDSARLFENLPGVSLYSAGGVSSLPALRGLADDRVRIKLDGMDLVASCPNHMNPPLSYVAPNQIASARVYAGISPVSVGGDSIAGSIVVNTQAPVFASSGEGWLLRGEIGSHFRSNGEGWGVDASARAIGEAIQISYSGSHAQAGNYSAGGNFKIFDQTGRVGHTLARDEVGSSAYETRNQQLSVAAKFDSGVLEASIGHQDMPFQNYPNQRMDLTENNQTRFNVRYRGTFGDALLDVRAYHEDVEHQMDFGADKRFWYGAGAMVPDNAVDGQACAPISFTCAAGMPMSSDSRNRGFSFLADVPSGDDAQIRFGADYQSYRLDDRWAPSGGGMWPGEFINIQDGIRDRSGLFAEWEQRFSPRWSGLFGIRYEHVHSGAGAVRGYDIDAAPPGSAMMTLADASAFNAQSRVRRDDNFDATALWRLAVNDTLNIDFGVARKTRSPNLYERYTWSTWAMAAAMNNFVGDGNGYVGDVNLSPEIANTASVSLEWHSADERHRLVISPWYTDVKDFIDAVSVKPNPTPNAFNVLRYANQDARLLGVDISGQVALADTDYGRFDLNGVIGYVDGENRDSEAALYNIMPLNLRLGLSQRWGNWENQIEVQGVSAKNELSRVRNEIQTPGYALLNLRLGYRLKKLKIDAGIENLFDRLYALPLGGAYLGQGRTMMFAGTPYGIAVPGAGRSFNLGFSLEL